MSRVLEENADSYREIAYGTRGGAVNDSILARLTALEAQQSALANQPQLSNAAIQNLLRNSDFAYSTNAYSGAGSVDELFGWTRGADVAQPVTNVSANTQWDKINGWVKLLSKALADDLSYQFPKRAILPGVTYYLSFSARLGAAANTQDLSVEFGVWDKTAGKDNWIEGALVGSESSNAPVITVVGAPGGTTYKYVVVATLDTGETLVSAEAATNTGNAALDATNYNQIGWAAVSGVLQYRLYRTAGATLGLIAQIDSGTTSYKDQGATLVAGAVVPPAAPPQARATLGNFGTQLSVEWKAFATQFRVPSGYALGQTGTDKQFFRLGLRTSAASVPEVLIDRIGLSLQPGGWSPAVEDRSAAGDISINPVGDGGQGGTTIIYGNELAF